MDVCVRARLLAQSIFPWAWFSGPCERAFVHLHHHPVRTASGGPMRTGRSTTHTRWSCPPPTPSLAVRPRTCPSAGLASDLITLASLSLRILPVDCSLRRASSHFNTLVALVCGNRIQWAILRLFPSRNPYPLLRPLLRAGWPPTGPRCCGTCLRGAQRSLPDDGTSPDGVGSCLLAPSTFLLNLTITLGELLL
jgi:hypothetical protein